MGSQLMNQVCKYIICSVEREQKEVGVGDHKEDQSRVNQEKGGKREARMWASSSRLP